ncbi:MAG TPA: XRE family transcriptional regulator [Polyangiales bacterium]|nr:XRE family transcriptional regulator [Polyangiales bacterium]
MSLDLALFGNKLRRQREMIGETVEQLSAATGIPVDEVQELENGQRAPTGDQVLILADRFLCDFKFFISNESATPIERTEKLFRAHSRDLSSQDRRAIQEFLFLCENEAFLLRELGRQAPLAFKFEKRGNYAKGHGVKAAGELRRVLGTDANEVPEVFFVLRRLGMHVFRRKLNNRRISGLFIQHPAAGPCVLVNYDEDVYRQRFTAMHEGGHAIFDIGDEYVVSIDGQVDRREIRANSFAGAFLVSPELVKRIPDASWTEDRITERADQLRVNPMVLLIALEREGRISADDLRSLKGARIPRSAKVDPELPSTLSARSLARRKSLLERGISNFYAELCFEAYSREVISAARLAEVLLIDRSELREVAVLFGVQGI